MQTAASTYTLRGIAVGTTLVLTGVGGAGCGSGGPAKAVPSASTVPPGVVAQYAVMEEEIAANGGDTTSGDWRIAYIVEAAEPWFQDHTAASCRAPSPGETHHIEILPIEKSTGRFVPDVPISMEIVGADGTVVDSRKLISLYGKFFHYAHNFRVPTPGTYTLRVRISPPTFGRHGHQAHGPKLPRGATVEFPNVELTTKR